MNRDNDPLECTLNHQLGNTTVVDTRTEVATDFVILENFVGIILAAKPVGVPAFDISQPQADWIGFLSHLIRRFRSWSWHPPRW